MIVIQLQGGLGNQMFQYAFGKALSLNTGEELLLDTSFLEKKANGYTQRHLELHVFPIQDKIADKNLLDSFEKAESTFILDRVLRKINPSPYITIREKFFQYQSLELPSKEYKRFIGFWQTERYFSNHRNKLNNIFTFDLHSDDVNREMLENIKTFDAISLHIRRGDYITNSSANAFHGTCDLDYYARGVNMILPFTSNPALFVFSDDPHWVKENIQFDIPTFYVQHNQGNKSYLDMGLMAHCKHHIIANSSFSWWGAWLNPSSEKIVIAPKNWFADTSVVTSDLIPISWKRI